MKSTPLGVTIATWVGYVIAFPILHETPVNDMAAVLLLVPLLTTAWHFGTMGGWLGAGLLFPVQIALFLLGEHTLGWDMVAGVEGFVGLAGLAVTAIVAGYTVDRLRGAERQVGEKDRLVAAVSHEVRNPLTGVVGLSESLLEQWDELEPGEAKELVSLITTEAHAMQAIVEDLLDFSRLTAGSIRLESRHLDLGSVARDMEPAATGSAEVVGDPGRVSQIVRNLVNNAVQHGGPSVRLETGTSESAGWLEVRDDGEGIDPDVEVDLFTPFASSGQPGSTGLGLTVSRELARAMDGDLRYLRRDEWTVFRLELPLADQTVAAGSPAGHRS